MQIIYEDDTLLAINKPAGLSSESGKALHPSAEKWAQEYTSDQRREAVGAFQRAPYLRAVHRLDRASSGVLLFSKTKSALTNLMDQFENRTVEKIYIAEVVGTLPAASGTLQHHLAKSPDGKAAIVSDMPFDGSKPAECAYLVLEKTATGARVEIVPKTGRFHQIRAQLAHIGCPVLGDTRYGGQPWLEHAVKLHACRLIVQHPKTGERLTLEAPLPDNWQEA
ncbi:MAG: RluA family pseudouridine synthase [Lewinellaceae bacterium]|nr:RluA family pseudouridine synthase [Lewinellaceae bacterium]